jgi:predicted PhzF superfamily epimerase YddE/YHI9
MSSISTIQLVDAFTDRPFSGNPAAVAFCDSYPSAAFLQAVATELNLSETAFVRSRGDGTHDLRWFTPTTEVALCGHATLASAHTLGGNAVFHTKSGTLTCTEGVAGEILMDFPLDRPTQVEMPKHMASLNITWAGRGIFDLLFVADDAAQVRSFVADREELIDFDARCVIISAPGDQPGIDFVSRVFAPRVGVLEDPVTGSAHCTLAAYWGDRLGRNHLYGEQASTRGGIVSMSRKEDRVVLGGHAVTVGRMELMIDESALLERPAR